MNNKLFILFLTFLIIFLNVENVCAEDTYILQDNTSMFSDDYENYINNAEVSINGDTATVKIETPVVDNTLHNLLYYVALKTHEETHAKNIIVESYFMNEPILRLKIFNYDFDNPIYEDIRTPGYKIKSDLNVFDVIVHSVKLSDSKASITLEYLGGEKGFWKDYLAMSLLILEDAPWVNSIEIIYLGDEENKKIEVNSDDILKYYSGEISADELVNSIHVSSYSKDEENGWSIIYTIILIILAIVALIIALIFLKFMVKIIVASIFAIAGYVIGIIVIPEHDFLFAIVFFIVGYILASKVFSNK
jgi:hypothetical protein